MQKEEGFFTNNPAEGAINGHFKPKGRPYWYLLVCLLLKEEMENEKTK